MAPSRLRRQRDQPGHAEEMVLSSLGAVLKPRRTQGIFSGQPLPQSSLQLAVAWHICTMPVLCRWKSVVLTSCTSSSL